MSTDVEVREDEPAATASFTDIYLANYYSLIRLAALLVGGAAACEDVVQEAFVRVYARRPKLRDETQALAYLRQAVVSLSRSSLRRMRTARTYATPLATDAAVIQALRRLPRRQREVLALRYYAELSEAQVADTFGLSVGSVKAYASRGLDRLGQEMAGMP